MIVIAILAIPFIFYFNKTDPGAQRSSIYGRIFGRDVSVTEMERSERLFDLASDLGMRDFLGELIGNARSENEAKKNFALNYLILRHEADALGLRPTAAAAAAAVSNLPAFRSDAGFDMKRYSAAVQNYLGPRGFSEAQIQELAAAQICLERVKQLVGAAAAISAEESKKNFEQYYSRVQLAVARFNRNDLANEIQISDDDIKQYFEAHQKELMSDEKRKVQFVRLALTDEEKKLTGKERIEVLQKFSDKANDLSQALAEKGADFSAVATKFQTPVTTTGDFTLATPDPQLKEPELAQAAFQLSSATPTSEPIQTPDGYYILHLANVISAQPLTLEQAKPKIVEALKATRERELLSTRAAKAVHDLREALKGGEPLATAASRLNLKLEQVPPFILADELNGKPEAVAQNSSPDLPLLKRATADSKTNEVSEPLPTKDGMEIAVVEKRDPPQAGESNQQALLDERYLETKRRVMFDEWLRDRQRAAGVLTVNVNNAG